MAKGLLTAIEKQIKEDNSGQKWIIENAQYITMMGSHAYDTFTVDSDYDIYGFTIPPREYVFPYNYGYVFGFDKAVPKFEQYQKHHIEYQKSDIDCTLYSITKYFRLLMDNNPNMIDSLFTKREYVLKCTKIAEIVRLNKKEFLHKGSYHKFKGYAYSQLQKARSKNRTGKRVAIIEKYGFDVKFASHIVRLLDEAEQILLEGDIDLTRNKEQVKAIKRGDVSLEEIERIFADKGRYLTELYETSKLRHKPDVDKIRILLMRCLEEWFGKLDNVIKTIDKHGSMIRDIEVVLERYR